MVARPSGETLWAQAISRYSRDQQSPSSTRILVSSGGLLSLAQRSLGLHRPLADRMGVAAGSHGRALRLHLSLGQQMGPGPSSLGFPSGKREGKRGPIV